MQHNMSFYSIEFVDWIYEFNEKCGMGIESQYYHLFVL